MQYVSHLLAITANSECRRICFAHLQRFHAEPANPSLVDARKLAPTIYGRVAKHYSRDIVDPVVVTHVLFSGQLGAAIWRMPIQWQVLIKTVWVIRKNVARFRLLGPEGNQG